MQALSIRQPLQCSRSVHICATANQAQQKLPVVKRSLAGLPVHRAQGSTSGAKVLLPGMLRLVSVLLTCAGGLLVIPVLQPSTDNIPFGLALSWQRQSAAAHSVSSTPPYLQNDLYELQYVLDGEGEVTNFQKSAAGKIGARFLTHETLLVQLCAKSGVLQSIAAGDSILAPVGRAWCQLGAGTAASSDLTVLKLLVPGSLPDEAINQRQGVQRTDTPPFQHCLDVSLVSVCLQCTGCADQPQMLSKL